MCRLVFLWGLRRWTARSATSAGAERRAPAAAGPAKAALDSWWSTGAASVGGDALVAGPVGERSGAIFFWGFTPLKDLTRIRRLQLRAKQQA